MEKTEQSSHTTGDRFLAVAAHADDFELFCTGVCALGSVIVAVLALPEPERYGEFIKASKILGYEYILGNYIDGNLRGKYLDMFVTRCLDMFTPDIILTHDPWKPYQLHPDHRAVGFGVTDALTYQRRHKRHLPREIWYWNTAYPNTFVTVNPILKRKVLACYRSQPILQCAEILCDEYFHKVVLEENFG